MPEWTLSELVHVPDFFSSRSRSSISGRCDQHDGSWHTGDHIANLPTLQNTCVPWNIFCSESGCLGLQIKCSYWESQPANLHARKWSHLMSRGEAIGGCTSPEQLKICFLNKSSLIGLESLSSTGRVPIFYLNLHCLVFIFRAYEVDKCRVCYLHVIILQTSIFPRQFMKNSVCCLKVRE